MSLMKYDPKHQLLSNYLLEDLSIVQSRYKKQVKTWFFGIPTGEWFEYNINDCGIQARHIIS